MIHKRGNTYHYSFVFKGRRYRSSTRQGNPNVARQIESARRTQLAKGEVGIADKPRVPTLKEFVPEFKQHIETKCANKPKTVEFYEGRLPALLAFAPLGRRQLDAIDEELIDAYKRSRMGSASRRGRPFSISTINGELRTLRRLLRLAHTRKFVTDTPRVGLLGGETMREFVLSYAHEELYLHMAPDPLRDAAMLILDTGMRAGEALALRWQQVHLEPARASKFGYLSVRVGKSEKAKRNLSLTARVAAMLARRMGTVHGGFVFPGDRPGAWFPVTSLDHQHSDHSIFQSKDEHENRTGNEEAAQRPTSFLWFLVFRERTVVMVASGRGKVGNLLLVFHFSMDAKPGGGNVGISRFLRDFQGTVESVGNPLLVFHAFHGPGISTALR